MTTWQRPVKYLKTVRLHFIGSPSMPRIKSNITHVHVIPDQIKTSTPLYSRQRFHWLGFKRKTVVNRVDLYRKAMYERTTKQAYRTRTIPKCCLRKWPKIIFNTRLLTDSSSTLRQPRFRWNATLHIYSSFMWKTKSHGHFDPDQVSRAVSRFSHSWDKNSFLKRHFLLRLQADSRVDTHYPDRQCSPTSYTLL